MCAPKPDTIWGYLLFDGKNYPVLNRPINREIIQKIKKYKEVHNTINSSAPWVVSKYIWEIEEGRLYLTAINYMHEEDSVTSVYLPQKSNKIKMPSMKSKNIIENIFGSKRVFAEWCSSELRLLSKKEISSNSCHKKYMLTLKILHFKKGVLVDTIMKSEECTRKKLILECTGLHPRNRTT